MCHRFVVRLGLARRAAALAVCLLAGCDERDPSPSASNSLRLATSSELRDSGLLEVLLARFKRDTGDEVTLCGASEKADVQLLPAKEPKAAKAATDPSQKGRVVLWMTFLILGPTAGALGIGTVMAGRIRDTVSPVPHPMSSSLLTLPDHGEEG